MKRSNTQGQVLAALCAALTAVISPFAIPIGPVAVTLSLFAVLLAGALLRPGQAFASQLVYLVLGLVGMPVFAGFQSGPQVLAGPTGGYLAAYPFMALLLALVCRRTARLPLRMAGALAALVLCYGLGTLWYAALTGGSLAAGLALCVVPFVLPDLVKALCALLLARSLERRMGRLH